MTTLRLELFRTAIGATLLASLLPLSLPAMGQSEWVIHSFNGSRGYTPVGVLATDTAGNLYGVASGGASKYGFGIVYELVRPVSPSTAWTETILYNFTDAQDGYSLRAGLALDKAGDLYGTTFFGGEYGNGTVFELSPPATPGGAWAKSTIHSFQPANGDGGWPTSELVLDGDGNLYGATPFGGANQTGGNLSCCGTLFQLSPPATPGGAWTETILYSFNGQPAATPQGSPIFDANGNLYGTTYGSGGRGGNSQWGAVYRLSKPKTVGGAWVFRTLYVFRGGEFPPSTGGSPTGALTLHGKGILYGSTTEGGLYNSGVVFQLTPPALAAEPWTENVLYNFTWAGADPYHYGCEASAAPTNDGCAPTGHLLFDSSGNIFGTTTSGGVDDYGTLFELTPPATSGSDWTESILHSFGTRAGDAAGFPSGLIFSKNGVLLGVTEGGGNDGFNGAVFGAVK